VRPLGSTPRSGAPTNPPLPRGAAIAEAAEAAGEHTLFGY
jgi:hypothetical protein